jgi:uncharacterized RDD family membrane protein YckC
MNSDDQPDEIGAPAAATTNAVVTALENCALPVTSVDVSTLLATPWSRFWARSFDFILWLCLLDFPIAWYAPGALEHGFALITYLATLPLMILLDAVVYSFCRNTPGKSMAGIRVLNEGGTKVGFGRYLNRNFQVYLRGLALGSFIAVFTMLYSYSKLREHETLSWDQKTETRVLQVRSGWWRCWLVAFLCIGILGGLGYFATLMKSPEAQIRFAVIAVNIDTPKMIDEFTRFDGVQALPDLAMQYNFTILSEDADEADQEYREKFEAEMRKQVENTICLSDDLKPFRAFGTTFRYRFSNRLGGLITVISIRSSECGTLSTH